MIVLAFFVFYGVPYGLKNIFGIRQTLTSLQAGTICLALNCGAYMSEIIRAGIQAIDPGQMEAARSLGMSRIQAMKEIIMPQAVRYVLPAVGNEFIALLKETSVAGYVAVVDLTRAGNLIRNNTHDAVNPLMVVAICYLAMVIGLTSLLHKLEQKLSAGK